MHLRKLNNNSCLKKKTLSKLEISGNLLELKKFWQNPTTEIIGIIGTGEKLEVRRKGWLLLPLLLNIELEVLANAIKGKEIKCLHVKQKDV